MGVADRFYTPGMDTTNDGIEVDYVEHVLPIAGVDVHVYEWTAGRTPKGVVHIAHGAGDHARRYQRLANALVERGYAVVAADQLGHGRTGVGFLGLSNVGPGGMPATRALLRETILWTRARYRGIPLIGLGHSWGSILSQQLFARDATIFDGLVLTGSTLVLPGFINTGDFNAQWAGDGHGMSWISRDVAEVQAMIDDLYGFDIADSSVWTPLGAVQLLTPPPMPRFGRAARVPVLVQSGAEDVIGYGARGPRALAWAYRHVTRMRDVTLHIYPEARHEVFNELNRDEVTGHLLDWLAWHFEMPER